MPNGTVGVPNGTVTDSIAAPLRTTRAVAGVPRVIARAPVQAFQTVAPVSSNNNVAISIGDGAETFAGSGSNNIATVFGENSTARAFGGNFNQARVVGNNSFASATGNSQTATVVGDNQTVGGGFAAQ